MKQFHLIFIIAAVMALETTAQVMNRPIGQYPGNPSEHYGPTLVQDNSYRNLALHRTVYQSSSWDFNLTSQLLTDGIIDEQQPAWLNVSTPEGPLPPHKREACIDGNEWTSNILLGGDTWLQYDWEGMSIDIDEVQKMNSKDSESGYSLPKTAVIGWLLMNGRATPCLVQHPADVSIATLTRIPVMTCCRHAISTILFT